MRPIDPAREVVRYQDGERVNHWMVAILFVLAALSGLSMFHPALFWLSNLFGGGPWTRILHPYIGVAMFLAFLFLAVRFASQNHMTANDRQWLKQWRDVVDNHEERLPEVGKYNAGQKVLFWIQVVCLIVLLVTGLVFWRPWFAQYFPIEVVRLATLLHAATATVLIIAIIVHIYAAIWVKGSIRAMTQGIVTRRWARKHHAAWYREVTRDPS
jgi:formate dehydrogenase subunit gamma